jgi:hypothetical protein
MSATKQDRSVIAARGAEAGSGSALGWTMLVSDIDIAAETQAAARSLALNTKLIGFEILPELLRRL